MGHWFLLNSRSAILLNVISLPMNSIQLSNTSSLNIATAWCHQHGMFGVTWTVSVLLHFIRPVNKRHFLISFDSNHFLPYIYRLTYTAVRAFFHQSLSNAHLFIKAIFMKGMATSSPVKRFFHLSWESLQLHCSYNIGGLQTSALHFSTTSSLTCLLVFSFIN